MLIIVMCNFAESFMNNKTPLCHPIRFGCSAARMQVRQRQPVVGISKGTLVQASVRRNRGNRFLSSILLSCERKTVGFGRTGAAATERRETLPVVRLAAMSATVTEICSHHLVGVLPHARYLCGSSGFLAPVFAGAGCEQRLPALRGRDANGRGLAGCRDQIIRGDGLSFARLKTLFVETRSW